MPTGPKGEKRPPPTSSATTRGVEVKPPNLFYQVARIARRGRKRYLGLVFVTQLPSHLPDEVLGLVNNWILHKLTDIGVVNPPQGRAGGERGHLELVA
jgi:hypothetical protein